MRTGARSARRLVRDAAGKLDDAGVPEPRASAEVLLAELLGVRRSELTLLEEPPTAEEAKLYDAWVSRRQDREPVQRILGYAYFRNLRFDLDEHTLIPRPDTESVVDAVLEAVDRRGALIENNPAPGSEAPCRVLDLGTGSGAIAVSVAQERPSCYVHATDHSEGALKIARRNTDRAGVMVCFHKANLTSGLDDLAGGVDVLVSNPPYVRSADIPKLAPEVRDWDPRSALDGGPDGLEFYRRLFAEATPLLADGAEVVLEVGDGQGLQVLEMGLRAGYEPLGIESDLTGTPRAVLLRWGSG